MFEVDNEKKIDQMKPEKFLNFKKNWALMNFQVERINILYINK